jgi:hypothetical protein
MHFDSYTCDLCILQKQESLTHLFFRCSFEKNYWHRVGVLVPSWFKPDTKKSALLIPPVFEKIDQIR